MTEFHPWHEGDDVTVEIRGPGGGVKWIVQGDEQITITHKLASFLVTATSVTLLPVDPAVIPSGDSGV